MNQLEELQNDLRNDELPADLKAYEKIRATLRPGLRVGWYFQDDKKFWEADGFEPREQTLYEGVIVPRPDLEMRGSELEPEDCVLVQIDYPCEKCYPEVTWFALRRLLDNPELVEVFPLNAELSHGGDKKL